jgi:hypothetical protein
MSDSKYKLNNDEQIRKSYKLPEKIISRGHTYSYLGSSYLFRAGAETAAKKLRKEGWGAIVHTSKTGLTNGVWGVYIRSKK